MAAGAAALQRLAFRPPTIHPAPQSAADELALRVSREGRMLRLAWNPNALPVRSASRAVLSIADGDHRSQLNLGPSELASGRLSYWPVGQDVEFRLEVFASDRRTANAIKVAGGSPRAALKEVSQTAQVPASSPAAAPPLKSAPLSKPRAVQPGTARRAKSTGGDGAVLADGRPSPFMPISKPEPAVEAHEDPMAEPSVPQRDPPAPVPTPIRRIAREPSVVVVAEPMTDSRFGRAVKHIPLLRRLSRTKSNGFIPAEPKHQVRPVLTAEERRELTRPVPIDVKVYVAESGKVEYAEVLPGRARMLPALAVAAVYAARRWDFVPARLGEEWVPSEVILHFRFAPPVE
jgi:hypothetical protein